MSQTGHGLGTRTVRGMAWAYGSYVGGRVLVLVAMAILTRLLTPEEFGVVALVTTFMLFLDAVRDLGLAQAVIVGDPRHAAERAQTAFSWSVLIGFSLTLVTIVSAPLAASFFDEPQLRELLPVMGATFLIRSLGSTHDALARKAINYRVRTVSELSDVVVRGVVGIVLAALGFGAWALVIGYVVGALASTVALWLMVDFRPRPRLSRLHLRDMVTFGGMLTLVDIGAVFAQNLDYIFIGKVLGAAALGFYTIAFRLPEMVVVNLAMIAGDVLFPAYALVDRERLRSAYLVALRYTAMLTVPIVAVMVVLADPLVLVVFGDQWDESAPVMQILALTALVATLAIPCGTIFKVTGKAWILIARVVPLLVVLTVLLTIYADDGIRAVALINLVLVCIDLPITIAIASRQLRLPYADNVRAVLPSIVGAAAMGAAMLAVTQLVSGPIVTLLIALPVGLAVYFGGLVAFARDDLKRLQHMAFPRTAPSRPAA